MTTTLLDGLLADLRPRATGSGPWSSGLDEAGWRTPTAGRGLGRRDPGRPPGVDRRGGGARRDRQGRPGTTSCCEAIDDPDGFVDARPPQIARLTPTELLARWGAPRGSAGRRRCEHLPDGQKLPWFGPPMSAPRWRPPGSWRPGRTGLDVADGSRRRRRAARPGPPRRPPRRAHPRLRLRQPRPGAAPAEEFRVRLSAPPGGEGPGSTATPTRRRPSPARPGTSRCWSPSASTVTTSPSTPTGRRRPLARRRAGLRRPAGGGGGRSPSSDRCGSATARASTATGSPRCARCSRAAPLDVLTGDYLAELTMLILGRDQMKDPSLGYARTFVRQAEDCLGLALERGVRIVSNAGGLNPAGLAERLREVARGQGLDPRDRVRRRRRPADRAASSGWRAAPLTANAYLGGFGIAAALSRRRRRRRHRPRHRRLARRRAGDRPLRLDRDGVRRARRRRRGRPRHRVRHPGDRRELQRLPHRRPRPSRSASRSRRSPPTARA